MAVHNWQAYTLGGFIMAFPYVRTKVLTNTSYSDDNPTNPRQDVDGAIQECFDMLNGTADGSSGADYIKSAPIPGLFGGIAGTIFQMLSALKTYADSILAQIQGVVLGQIPDNSLTTVKIVPGTANYFLHTKADGTGVEWADVPQTDLTPIINRLNQDLENFLLIKLQLTGLKAGKNVWSDTIEDATGINESLSNGYYFDTPNKSIKTMSFPTEYNATSAVLPVAATPSWTKSSAGTVNESVASSKLTLTASTGGNSVAYERESGLVVANKTKIVEMKAVHNVATGQLEIWIGDGTRRLLLLIKGNGTVSYTNASGVDTSIATSLNVTSDFIVKAEFDNVTGAKIYFNGVQIGATIPYASIQTSTNNFIRFGINASASAVNASVYYTKYTIDVSATTGTATVFWDASNSDGTLIKAAIEAQQSLGTGTATYYFSRDNGTTFTQCTIDTITDISAQPSGTSIVLKVELTGNAELQGVAWGGSVI